MHSARTRERRRNLVKANAVDLPDTSTPTKQLSHRTRSVPVQGRNKIKRQEPPRRREPDYSSQHGHKYHVTSASGSLDDINGEDEHDYNSRNRNNKMTSRVTNRSRDSSHQPGITDSKQDLHRGSTGSESSAVTATSASSRRQRIQERYRPRPQVVPKTSEENITSSGGAASQSKQLLSPDDVAKMDGNKRLGDDRIRQRTGSHDERKSSGQAQAFWQQRGSWDGRHRAAPRDDTSRDASRGAPRDASRRTYHETNFDQCEPVPECQPQRKGPSRELSFESTCSEPPKHFGEHRRSKPCVGRSSTLDVSTLDRSSSGTIPEKVDGESSVPFVAPWRNKQRPSSQIIQSSDKSSILGALTEESSPVTTMKNAKLSRDQTLSVDSTDLDDIVEANLAAAEELSTGRQGVQVDNTKPHIGSNKSPIEPAQSRVDVAQAQGKIFPGSAKIKGKVFSDVAKPQRKAFSQHSPHRSSYPFDCVSSQQQLGAFRTPFADASPVRQPTNQEAVNILKEVIPRSPVSQRQDSQFEAVAKGRMGSSFQKRLDALRNEFKPVDRFTQFAPNRLKVDSSKIESNEQLRLDSQSTKPVALSDQHITDTKSQPYVHQKADLSVSSQGPQQSLLASDTNTFQTVQSPVLSPEPPTCFSPTPELISQISADSVTCEEYEYNEEQVPARKEIYYDPPKPHVVNKLEDPELAVKVATVNNRETKKKQLIEKLTAIRQELATRIGSFDAKQTGAHGQTDAHADTGAHAQTGAYAQSQSVSAMQPSQQADIKSFSTPLTKQPAKPETDSKRRFAPRAPLQKSHTLGEELLDESKIGSKIDESLFLPEEKASTWTSSQMFNIRGHLKQHQESPKTLDALDVATKTTARARRTSSPRTVSASPQRPQVPEFGTSYLPADSGAPWRTKRHSDAKKAEETDTTKAGSEKQHGAISLVQAIQNRLANKAQSGKDATSDNRGSIDCASPSFGISYVKPPDTSAPSKSSRMTEKQTESLPFQTKDNQFRPVQTTDNQIYNQIPEPTQTKRLTPPMLNEPMHELHIEIPDNEPKLMQRKDKQNIDAINTEKQQSQRIPETNVQSKSIKEPVQPAVSSKQIIPVEKTLAKKQETLPTQKLPNKVTDEERRRQLYNEDYYKESSPEYSPIALPKDSVILRNKFQCIKRSGSTSSDSGESTNQRSPRHSPRHSPRPGRKLKSNRGSTSSSVSVDYGPHLSVPGTPIMSGKDGRKVSTKGSPRSSTSSLSQQRLDRHAEKSNSLPLQRAARAQDRRSVHCFVASEVGAQGYKPAKPQKPASGTSESAVGHGSRLCEGRQDECHQPASHGRFSFPVEPRPLEAEPRCVEQKIAPAAHKPTPPSQVTSRDRKFQEKPEAEVPTIVLKAEPVIHEIQYKPKVTPVSQGQTKVTTVSQDLTKVTSKPQGYLVNQPKTSAVSDKPIPSSVKQQPVTTRVGAKVDSQSNKPSEPRKVSKSQTSESDQELKGSRIELDSALQTLDSLTKELEDRQKVQEIVDQTLAPLNLALAESQQPSSSPSDTQVSDALAVLKATSPKKKKVPTATLR